MPLTISLQKVAITGSGTITWIILNNHNNDNVRSCIMMQIIIIEDPYHYPCNDNLVGPEKIEEFVLSRQSTLVLIQFKRC